MVSSVPDPFRTAPLKHAVWSLDGLILVRLEASCIGSGAERGGGGIRGLIEGAIAWDLDLGMHDRNMDLAVCLVVWD